MPLRENIGGANVKDQDFAIYRDIKNRGGREGKNDKTPSCCH